MGTLAFDDFCFGNIGIIGDIGVIGKVAGIRFMKPAIFYMPAQKTGERGGHLEMIQAFFMGTLVFDDFCFGNIGIPGNIGTIGVVAAHNSYSAALFIFGLWPAGKNRGKGRTS